MRISLRTACVDGSGAHSISLSGGQMRASARVAGLAIDRPFAAAGRGG